VVDRREVVALVIDVRRHADHHRVAAEAGQILAGRRVVRIDHLAPGPGERTDPGATPDVVIVEPPHTDGRRPPGQRRGPASIAVVSRPARVITRSWRPGRPRQAILANDRQGNTNQAC